MTANVKPACPRCHSKNLAFVARGRMDGGKWTKYFWVSCADCARSRDHGPSSLRARHQRRCRVHTSPLGGRCLTARLANQMWRCLAGAMDMIPGHGRRRIFF